MHHPIGIMILPYLVCFDIDVVGNVYVCQSADMHTPLGICYWYAIAMLKILNNMTEVGTPIRSTWWLEGTLQLIWYFKEILMRLWNVYVNLATCIHPWASCYKYTVAMLKILNNTTEVGTPIWSTWWLEGTLQLIWYFKEILMRLWNVYVNLATCIHPWASCYKYAVVISEMC